MKRLFLIVLLSLPEFQLTRDIIRKTQYGRIRGSIQSSRINSSVQFIYFTGVPYARSPVGNLRFQEAKPPIPWRGIRDANSPGNICVQISKQFMGDEVLGNEDCLFLEIAEPITVCRPRSCEKLPVMVWIHGGSFLFSSYQETGPDTFMEEEVVIVSIQYRLNVFGFLTTMDYHAKGNLGLKDQALALVWIKNNIANFGGDPNRITLFGASAGGASAQFHMLSPLSRGLFNGAISQSGVTLATSVFQRKPKEMVRRLGQALGITTSSSKILVQQLRTVRPEILIKTAFNQTIMGPYLLYDEVPFLPVIEHESDAAFLTQRVYQLLRQGKFVSVPYMLGENTEEGSFPYSYIDGGNVNISIYEENPELFLPISMNIPVGSRCINYSNNEIRNFFFNNGSFTDKVNWITFMGQEIRGIRKTAEFVCKKTRQYPIYFYVFSFVGTNSLGYIGRAGHYSDVLKLFYPINPDWSTTLTAADRLVQRRIIKLWVNFAHTGNPTPYQQGLLENVQWPRFCNRKEYLDIGDNLIVKSNPDSNIYEFWEKLFEECGFPPFNTY